MTIMRSLILTLLWFPLSALAFDHAAWDALLKQQVKVLEGGKATQVDYAGMKAERKELGRYLNQLSQVTLPEFEGWDRDEQLAFLINAYNAWTVELILTRYPDLQSIRDLGSLFRSPWKQRFIPLFGEERSLDEIEHDLIRGSGNYPDPRIHFAVNCASIGCPALRAEAYVGGQLNEQLEEQTRLFLADASRNRLAEGELKVSSIFKWYREDFEKGWLGYQRLEDFLAAYAQALDLNAQAVQSLKTGDLDIDFLDYDCKLNDIGS